MNVLRLVKAEKKLSAQSTGFIKSSDNGYEIATLAAKPRIY